MGQFPLVSVIVPTRNSADSLYRCLDSIAQQSYPSVEIVVVDNHSSDETVAIARSFTPHVRICGPERSTQRNVGASIAIGAYLLFVDSDMVLDRRVIEQCIGRVSRDGDTKGVIIPERSIGSGFWARCKGLERSCYVGDDTIEAARFFDRAAFEAVGGYDEELTAAEDWDLSQRMRRIGAVRRIDAYITHLEGHLTLRGTMRSKFYYGKTLGRYIRKQPGHAARQFQFIRPAFIRHWRRLLAHPMLVAGIVILKGCEFIAGGAGMALVASQRERTTRTP